MFAGCVIIAAAMIFAATPAMAAYAGGGGTESDPYIWTGSIGSPEDSVVVGAGDYVKSTGYIGIYGDGSLTVHGSWNSTAGVGINGDGSLTVHGSWNSTAGAWELGHTTTGTLNIEAGGIINRPASYMYLGRVGGTGIVNINGGTANFNQIKPDKNATGEIYQVAGDFTINSLLLGYQTTYAGQSVKYEISGGTSTMGEVTIGSLDDGKYIANGRLEVIGNGATSITATTMNLRDTLAFSFGSAGVTLIEIENLNLAAHMATIELNLDSDIATGVYSLFSFDSLTGDALDNAVLAGMLDLNYAGSHDVTLGLSGNTVQATVVPEPATMGLLGLGLAGLIARRRKH